MKELQRQDKERKHIPPSQHDFFHGKKRVGQGEEDMGSKRPIVEFEIPKMYRIILVCRDGHAEPCDRVPEILLHAECRLKIEEKVYF